MRRGRVLLLLLLIVAGALVFLWWLGGQPLPVVEAPAPPAEVRREFLQADAEGSYVAGYRFPVGQARFAGFRLRPQPLIMFARRVGSGERAACLDAQITPDAVHLRCDYPQVGTVTIDGRFLIRSATNRLDVPVVSAVVTVRAPSGETVYSARDSFVWEPDPDQ